MACKACRTRKIKCDRTRPACLNCRQRSDHCTYAGERRTRRWAAPQPGIDGRQPSASELGSATRTHEATTRPAPGPAPAPAPAPAPTPPTPTSTSAPARANAGSNPSNWAPATSESILEASFMHMAHEPGAVPQTPTSSSLTQDDNLLDKILGGDDMQCLKDTNPALWMRVSDGDEYTGPSSGISTVSDLGLDWVRQNVPDSDVLCRTIHDIRNDILSHLRQPKCIPRDLPKALSTPRSPDNTPEPQVLKYVDAYFSTVQVIFPVLDRDTFLARLRATGTKRFQGNDYSWQALLNAVLASGCRAALSDETADAFKESGCETWGYFRNALSYESRIVHGAPDLLAVQAMAVLAVFAQGLSSPMGLEWSLSSMATRLAQSLALNRHPPPEWNLSEDEKRERDRVFWVVYCLDKSIALRSGRPSAICDEEISSCFPRGVSIIQREEAGAGITAGAPPFDLFLCFAKLARICGDISRMLYSATALYTPSSRLVGTANRLLQNLRSWMHSIPAEVRPGKTLRRISDTCGLSRGQIISLHGSYYYVLCAIYRRFTPIFTQDSKNLEPLIDQRSHISHIEAARSIALLTKHLDLESFSPAWLVFYYPFTALTTIFVHIVTKPPCESTKSDIALMETVVGFFGRLEYVTSGDTAFTKASEFVRQARTVTDRYNDRNPHQPTSNRADANTRTEFGRSVQNCTGEQEDGSGILDFSHVQGVDSNPLFGRPSVFGVSPPPTEEDRARLQQPASEGPDHDLGIIQPLCSDHFDIFMPDHSDMSHVNWLGDWVPAG